MVDNTLKPPVPSIGDGFDVDVTSKLYSTFGSLSVTISPHHTQLIIGQICQVIDGQ